MSDVVVVPTGTANLASVLAGLRRVGALPRVARNASDLAEASHAVLPGVGSFGAAAAALAKAGMREAMVRRLTEGRATLAICVGMQLLASASEESPTAPGLGIVADTVGRFAGPVLVPQLGWNQVRPGPNCDLVEPGWAYFANSYRLESIPSGWDGATSDHGGSFVAALQRGEVLACQFHPELSGSWGSDLLARWLRSTGGGL